MADFDPNLIYTYPDVKPEGRSGGWSWFLIILLILVIAAAITFLVLWLVQRDRQEELQIFGVSFKVASDTSIQASWTSVGSNNDVVTLFVYETGKGIRFNNNGTPSTTVAGRSSVTDPNTVKTVTVTGLIKDVTYDAVLVVTNSGISGYNGGNTGTGLTTGSNDPGIKFTITSLGQTGQIIYDTEDLTVEYELGSITINNNLFHFDSEVFICTTSQSQPLTSTSLCPETSFVLHDKTPTTNNTELGIILKIDLTTTTEENTAKLEYNTTIK